MDTASHRRTQHDHSASLSMQAQKGEESQACHKDTEQETQFQSPQHHQGLQGTGGCQSRLGGEELKKVITKKKKKPLTYFLGIPEAMGSTPSFEGSQADTSPVFLS